MNRFLKPVFKKALHSYYFIIISLSNCCQSYCCADIIIFISLYFFLSGKQNAYVFLIKFSVFQILYLFLDDETLYIIYQVLFVSPERFLNAEFSSMFSSTLFISLVVVDEAHCISEW